MTPTTLATRSRNESNEKAISREGGRRRRYMASSSLARQDCAFLRRDRVQYRIDLMEHAQTVLVNHKANDDPHRRFPRPVECPAPRDLILHGFHERGTAAFGC